MGEIAYVNGRLGPESEAAVSIRDHGFLYGDGVFETMRASEGKPFLLEEHIGRLRQGLEALRIGDISAARLVEAISMTIEANAYPEAVIRISVTRGQGIGRMKPAPDATPTVVVLCDKMPEPCPDISIDGIAAITVPDTRGGWSSVKSLNFLAALMARKEADIRGAYEAFFTDGAGGLLEGCVSNVFAVGAGRLVTPPLDGRILAGVTRQCVLELAARASIQVEQAPIDASKTDELFMTNSVIEIVPVISLNGMPVGNAQPGAVTRRLQALYKDRVDNGDAS